MTQHLQLKLKPIARLTFHPGLATAYLFVSGFFLAHWSPALLSLPCLWKALFGVPCPTCGAGRCVAALLKGDLLQAISLNPLIFLAVVIGLFVSVLWLLQLISARRIVLSLSLEARHFARIFAIAAILLNYAYLLYFDI